MIKVTKTTKNKNEQATLLEKLKAQREKLDARIQLAEARTKKSERKQDIRRKILIGSYYLDKARKEEKMHELKEQMDSYLSRESDRKLFDLHNIENSEKKEE